MKKFIPATDERTESITNKLPVIGAGNLVELLDRLHDNIPLILRPKLKRLNKDD